jgi:outer membrane protein TolC
MSKQLWNSSRLALLAAWAMCAIGCVAFAQSPVAVNEAENIAAPISPAKSPGPMSLDQCLDMGFQHQPALDAARASLSAAHSGQQAVRKMILPRLMRKDLGIRREQSAYGVTIANAALSQAEWDTRYAITRNFFTVQYIRAQQKVVGDVLKSLDDGRKKVEKIVGSGDPDVKVTTLDVKAIRTQIAIVNAKKSQADNGMERALAALREAMGLRHDYPLEIAVVDLPLPGYKVVEVAKDDKGNVLKDKKGKVVTRDVYKILYEINNQELISAAVANRGEMVQASAANRVTELEIAAQRKIFGYKGNTFAWASDIHVQPLPYSSFNGEYKPGATGLEYPTNLAGRKADRVQRAYDLFQRSNAVVEKATNLVSLDVENQYLKWKEAATEYCELMVEFETAQKLPDEVMKLMQNKDLTGAAIIQANITSVMFRTQLNDALHMHALALAGLERASAGAFHVYPIPAAPSLMPK